MYFLVSNQHKYQHCNSGNSTCDCNHIEYDSSHVITCFLPHTLQTSYKIRQFII
nr:MAG TPA: hypothetical protein [Caudoviricetes sp.]